MSLWRWPSSGLLRPVDWYEFTDVSEVTLTNKNNYNNSVIEILPSICPICLPWIVSFASDLVFLHYYFSQTVFWWHRRLQYTWQDTFRINGGAPSSGIYETMLRFPFKSVMFPNGFWIRPHEKRPRNCEWDGPGNPHRLSVTSSPSAKLLIL
jgi:hypothetical protein